MCTEQQTEALLQMIADLLGCQFLSDLHDEQRRLRAKKMLVRQQDHLQCVFGAPAYHKVCQYIIGRDGGKP